MKKAFLLFLVVGFLITPLKSQLHAPFNLFLPLSYVEADSILRLQGFVKESPEHLTYLPGLIAYVFKYQNENNIIYLHGTPETKTIYRETVMHLGEKGKKFYFEQEYKRMLSTYGKPSRYETKENPLYEKYEAVWSIDGARIEINGWLDTYVLPYEICKKEQPRGVPLNEAGEKLNCY